MRKRNALILLAGGRGKRMGSAIPKQFLDLGGEPIIRHSLKTIQKSDLIDEVILVSGAEDIQTVRDIVDRGGFDKVSHIVAGGEERYLSVVNGVLAICEKGGCEAFDGKPEVILIHDGARPFVDDEIIKRCLDNVSKDQGCVAAVPSKDTVKIADENGIVTDEPPRRNVWLMQTPQCFDADVIYRACLAAKKAYEEAKQNTGIKLPEITDDAQMVNMYLGKKIKLVMGSYDNIKITTPEDINVAEKILEAKIGHIS